MLIFGFPKPPKSSFGEVFGASLGSLGVSWAVLARLGCVRDVLWVRLGASEGILEASWGHLGASWEDLGGVWVSLGSFLVPFWEYFWKIICHLKQNVKIAKNLGKPMVFH